MIYANGSRGLAQSGSAPRLGPGGRKFESCSPDHYPPHNNTAHARSPDCLYLAHARDFWLSPIFFALAQSLKLGLTWVWPGFRLNLSWGV